MLSNETVPKLREMHLGVMAGAFSAQLDDAQFQTVSFEDRFAMLVDAEWSARKSNRLTRLIRKAGYADPSACVENIEYLPERKLDRALDTVLLGGRREFDGGPAFGNTALIFPISPLPGLAGFGDIVDAKIIDDLHIVVNDSRIHIITRVNSLKI